uniref:Uncharacterized protein n=1 Tax=Pyxicephalus adspersus TaxID=30357 RepID=A0AAV3AW95_PYXAD|nr:TPA: hypothetical protein GDO54_011190 [Pyxicephalus adspersus]
MVRLTNFFRLLAWKPVKKFDPKQRWKTRLALTYAVSSWLVIGGIAYGYFFTKDETESTKNDNKSSKDTELDELDELDQEILEGKEVYSAKFIYNDTYIPLSKKLAGFFKPYEKSAEKSPKES